ncbi:GspH/FimT family pseudopilin [Pseudomonas sp. BN515]|uniref:GspH/FimT family pseudopilin n=1 Tax=Pseudomonas sp. BN515 TaxID=2567892 RepID=UPI0024540569|nr:GspH/FimT family pseudopilin [Pseudomonas sp. BN515]MDH4873340.1 prepilin-type N-terminal cleavage/methylation domain-containing protein [Pseudomonas sp. BN515]
MSREVIDQVSGPAVFGWSRQSGFTLVELMVTLAVLAILLGIAIPTFTDVTLGSKLRSQASDLVGGVALARSEAIKRNQAVTLCASANGTTCASSGGWQQGWIVRSSTGTVIQSHPAAPSGFLITASAHSIAFQPSGIASVSTVLKVCRASPTVGAQERSVSISLTGRTSVSKTTSGTCS